METNHPQEKHFTPDEDTPNDIRSKAEPITVGEPHLMAFIKCQPTSLIIPVPEQVDTEEGNKCEINYNALNQLGTTVKDAIVEVADLQMNYNCSSKSTAAGVFETTSVCNNEEQRDNGNISGRYSLNLGTNDPDKTLPSSPLAADPKRPHSRNYFFEHSSSGHNAACQVLGEIIDEAIGKIELKTQKQQARDFGGDHCIRSCKVSSITIEEDENQQARSEIHKGMDIQVRGQLNVSFASPLESCRVYTLSPSLSEASTPDITPEVNMSENEEETLNLVKSPHDTKSDIESTSDRHDLSPVAFKDNYSNSFPSNSFPTESNDNVLFSVNISKSEKAVEVQSNLDEDNVMPGQINHIMTSTMDVMPYEKLQPNIQDNDPSEERHCEGESREMINDETVETDNNSYKTNSSYETIQLTPRECQIYYPTKQMLPKIEQDMISSSCDLFDYFDNRQNTYSAGTETAASADLFSPSPQVSTKLSCHGNEMENQKQSDNSDLHSTHKSTRDLPVPDLDGRESPVVSITEARSIAHCPSDQSNKFTSSAELFSQTSDCSLMGPVKSSSGGECQINITERSVLNPWQDSHLNLSNTEPYKEIVKLIFDHPDARFTPQRSTQMPEPDEPVLVPGVKPEPTTSQINDSYLDNKHTNETPINRSDRQEEPDCEAESTKLPLGPNSYGDLYGSDTCNEKSANQLCEDNIHKENIRPINPLPRQCHASDDMNCDGNENIGPETMTNNTTQLHQNPMTNEQELFVVETSPTAEVRKIDGDYAQENHLIDGYTGSSVEDSTQRISPEWPTTERLINVPCQDRQSHSDCYLTLDPENKMTNEMCVSPVQIKANELQTVPLGLLAVQENCLEEINLDSLPQTSMPSSKKDLLPQMTVTRQTAQQWPAASIPLKLDQSSTLEFECSETRSGTQSRCREDIGLDEETTVYNLPEIRGLSLDGQQERNVNEPNNEVISQDSLNNPMLPAQIICENNFPDRGISSSSRNDAEVGVQIICEENDQENERNMYPLETLQFPQYSRPSEEYFANNATEGVEENITISNTQLRIEQLVNVLARAICDQESVSATRQLCQEVREVAKKDEVSLHSSQEIVPPKKEINELRSPLKKVSKLRHEPVEELSPHQLYKKAENEVSGEKENLTRQSISKEANNTEYEHDRDQNPEEQGNAPSRSFKEAQVEHLPLKKRGILPPWTDNLEIITNKPKKYVNNDNYKNLGEINGKVEKQFPEPSQPQYKLFDIQNDSDNEVDDDNEEEINFSFDCMTTSQPHYNLFDHNHANVRSPLQSRRYNGEVKQQLNMLRQHSLSINCETEKTDDQKKTGDQQVPVLSPTKLLGENSGENVTMYPSVSGMKHPKFNSILFDSPLVNAERQSKLISGNISDKKMEYPYGSCEKPVIVEMSRHRTTGRIFYCDNESV